MGRGDLGVTCITSNAEVGREVIEEVMSKVTRPGESGEVR